MTTRHQRLKNLGPKSIQWLNEIGVNNRDDLVAVGPVLAYTMLKHRFPKISLLLLYALQGAVDNRHWNSYSPEEKARLKAEVSAVTVTHTQKPE